MASRVAKVSKITKGGKVSKAPVHMQVHTEGLTELSRIIAFEAPPKVRRAFFDGLVEAARPALARAKALAPNKSGNLASSIELRAKRGRKARDIGTVQIGAPGEQVGVLEFGRGQGTVRPYQRRGKSGPVAVSAHVRRYYLLNNSLGGAPRFLVPAVEEESLEIASRVDTHIARYLDAALDRDFKGLVD